MIIDANTLIGIPPEYTRGLIPGYNDYLPSLKKYWIENRNLLELVFEQHDVSKHRSNQIHGGGTMRKDQPVGFFEKLGINDDKVKQTLFTPMAEILLTPQPKIPKITRTPVKLEDIPRLEDIAERFCTVINKSGAIILSDVKTNIKLNHKF